MYGRLLRYNLSICAGLGSWLIVVPVAATMLVLFAVMAMVSVFRTGSPAMVLETLGPLLLAFLAANLLRPEYQYGTLELALVRPVSFRAILTARLLAAAVVVLLLVSGLGWYMHSVVRLQFDLAATLLAMAVSMAFLASLAVAVATAWRSPMLGLGVAAVFWALDLVAGPRLNPLLTLHGYEANCAHPGEVWGVWWVGKLLLAGLAGILVMLADRAAARPLLQRTVARWARAGIAGVLIAVLYLASGAAYKVAWGGRHEEVLQLRSRLWYQEAFRVYGPLPVAYLMGPSFAHFVGCRPPWTRLPAGPGDRPTRERQYEEALLRQVAFGPPGSPWADHALLELGRRAPETDPDGRRLGIGALETLAKEYPNSPLVPFGLERLAVLYEAAGRRADSENALHRLLETHPTAEAARRAGRKLFGRLMTEGRLAEALWVAERRVAGASPDSRPEALVDLGSALAGLGRRDEAVAKLNEALAAAAQQMARLNAADKSPDDIDLLRKIGAARRRARDQLSALQVTGH